MKLLIIRHGDPDYESDSLTDKGFIEANLLADRLLKMDIDAFYCSPYGRAQHTAKPILDLLGEKAITYDWLGEFQGKIIDPDTKIRRSPWDFMPDFWTEQKAFFDKDKWLNHPLIKTGNVRDKYYEICSETDNLLRNHGYVRNGNFYNAVDANRDTVVIFCHFGVGCVMLSHILNISPIQLWHGFMALPSSVTTIVTEEREQGKAYFRCTGFGDISHLYAGDENPSFRGRWCETFSSTEERH